MINPSSINPLTLPSLSLFDRRLLPNCPAIYFVLDGDRVLYIGKANNLVQRWKAHQRWFQFKAMVGDIRLAWLECTELGLLTEIEASLIDAFEPEFNELRRGRSNKRSGVTAPEQTH